MTNSSKRKIAIVAFAKTSRHLAPFDDPSWEIWGLNEGYKYSFMKRWDRWYQLHPYWNFSREKNPNDPKHFEWLRTRPGPDQPGYFPIYMQEKFEDIPASVKYPLDEVIADVCQGRRNLTSTVAELIALAVYEKVDEIGIYGVEMATNTEWRYQRPGGEFVLGVAMGRGIKVTVPPGCGMLKGKLYGWEALPMIGRQELEMYYARMKKEEAEALGQFNCNLGAVQEVEDLLKEAKDEGETKRLQEALEGAKTRLPHLEQILNQIAGGRMVLVDLINRMDMQEKVDTEHLPDLYLGGPASADDVLTKGGRGDSTDVEP